MSAQEYPTVRSPAPAWSRSPAPGTDVVTDTSLADEETEEVSSSARPVSYQRAS